MTDDGLKYTQEKRSQGTIRRAYARWRAQQGMPDRCDNDKDGCRFYTEPLVWNGKPLKLILDHKDGVNSNNNPKNLRYLCPNCNSQLDTHGGANKGRVEKASGGFARRNDDEIREYTLPAEGARYEWNVGPEKIEYIRVSAKRKCSPKTPTED